MYIQHGHGHTSYIECVYCKLTLAAAIRTGIVLAGLHQGQQKFLVLIGHGSRDLWARCGLCCAVTAALFLPGILVPVFSVCSSVYAIS